MWSDVVCEHLTRKKGCWQRTYVLIWSLKAPNTICFTYNLPKQKPSLRQTFHLRLTCGFTAANLINAFLSQDKRPCRGGHTPKLMMSSDGGVWGSSERTELKIRRGHIGEKKKKTTTPTWSEHSTLWSSETLSVTFCAKSYPSPLSSYQCTQRKELTFYLRCRYCQNIVFNCCPEFLAAV